MKAPLTQNKLGKATGALMIELLIIVAMVLVVGGFIFFKLLRSPNVECFWRKKLAV